mgnify:CR=1 FL=1
MANTEVESLLNRLGQILAEDREYRVDGTLLYAKVDDASATPAIFKNLGNHILYRWPDLDSIGDPLMHLWDAADPDKRWAEIEYLIRDDRFFNVTYVYPDEIDPDEDPFVRRDRIVAKYFGDKPIVYPPLDDSIGQDFKL